MDFNTLYESFEDFREIGKISQLLLEIDKGLTGKMSQDRFYTKAAKEILIGETATIYLSDGGYSRLYVTYEKKPHVWLDRDLSLAPVITRWDALIK